MARENKFSVSDTASCNCSHGAWADGKQTLSCEIICREGPSARVSGEHTADNLMTKLEPRANSS